MMSTYLQSSLGSSPLSITDESSGEKSYRWKRKSDLVKSQKRQYLHGLSVLLLFDANAGKDEVDEEKVDGGEEGEEEEEEEEETGKDEDVDPRLSLQFSESLPLYIFPF